MTIEFETLMQINKKTPDKTKNQILTNLIQNQDITLLKIANNLLEITLKKRTKYLKRKITPIKYLELIFNKAIESWEESAYYKDLIGKRRSYESQDLEEIKKQYQIHCKTIAISFATSYSEYFEKISLKKILEQIPQKYKITNNEFIQKYLDYYWQYTTPPYNLVHYDAFKKTIEELEKNVFNLNPSQINQLKPAIIQQIGILKQFYEENINISNKYNKN